MNKQTIHKRRHRSLIPYLNQESAVKSTGIPPNTIGACVSKSPSVSLAMQIGLVDYGAGNLHSVQNALNKLAIPSVLVRNAHGLEEVDAVILPGVGACGDCAKQLHSQDLWQPLRDWLAADRPYLGICLGYQILFEHSDEFDGTEGLGILAGSVVRFPRSELKVPHMGWNRLDLVDPSDPLWTGLPGHPYVYFVHSFYPQPHDTTLVSSWADYGVRFAASVRRGNLVATQFHPEKSQNIGLRILKNFVKSAEEALIAY